MRHKLLLLAVLLLLQACSFPQSSQNIPIVASVTTTATGTPTPTQTPVPSPTPTSAPTPIPAVRIEEAEKALTFGDYENARKLYLSAYETVTENDIRAAALWGLSRTDYLSGNYASALDWLRLLTKDYAGTLEAARAYFLMGKTYDALQRHTEAAQAYSQYISLRPGVLDAYAQEALGDAFAASEDYTNALNAYQSALASPKLAGDQELKKKIAQMYVNLGSTEQALVLYDEIGQSTTNDYLKAEVDLLSGRVHLLREEKGLAYDKFLHAVQNYPLAYDSYSALVALVDAGVPVSDLDRGLVDYFAGQYGLALDAFTRYIESAPTDNDGTVHHYRALTQRALGYNEQAVAEWTKLIDNYPNNRYWSTAWDEKATTQWAYLGDYPAAAQTLLDFVNAAPSSPEASDYLYTAARIYERNGQLAEAASTWERVANEYPQSSNSLEALHQAGIALYRMAKFDEALVAFQRGMLLSNTPEDQARASFWAGKAQNAKGDTAAARATWQQAQSLDPTGYYSERAKDLLNNRAPFEEPVGYSLGANLAAERPTADSWIRVIFNLPPESDLSGPGWTGQDARFIRGSELWELGLTDEANAEFVNLRESVANDGVASYQLGNALLDMGLYRQAIYALRNTLTLAGLDEHHESLNVPAYFNHVRYGLYFPDLVVPAAKENNLHPLFLYSLIRQESLFDIAAKSGAGAQGLMQIVPSTGDSIVSSFGWPPNYTENDLYRPFINVRLGSYYLAANRNALDGDLYAALAAYNGGPGNAAIWKDLAGGDPDLQVEIIRFAETRDYLRSIYETYQIYKSLYSPSQ